MFFTRLLELDERLTSHIRITETQSRLKPIGSFFAHSGDSWFILLALLVIWLTTKGSWHRLSAVLAAGVIVLAVVVLIIKFTIKRRRPEGNWGAVYRNTDPHSFPSGHAARTAMLAIISIILGPVWLGILLLVWAPVVSLARVWMGVHYISDVIAGIVLGVIAGLIVSQLSPILITAFPTIF